MSASDLIAQRIRERGPITVAEFMSIVLYHPEFGYYARAERRTGRNGDFITSVDVGPLFGTLLARQFADMWRVMRDQAGPMEADTFDIVEAGAANGQLARDVLDAAHAEDFEFYRALRLHLVEASPAARAAQREMLARHAGKIASSATQLPDAVHGVVYSNELIDALPVHAIVMTGDGLRECYVDLKGDTFVERVGPPSTAALARHLRSCGATLEPGWRAEVNLAAVAWMTRACLSLHQGFILLIDYGHEAAELYSVTHSAGTLTTFTKHVSEARRAEDRPPWLIDPGSRDIASHVNLTAMRDVAEGLGCRTLGMLDQTYFMLALATGSDPGGDPTQGSDPPDGSTQSWGSDPRGAVKRRLALKTLILPGGLGSSQKVMIFGKNVGTPQLRGLAGPSRLT